MCRFVKSCKDNNCTHVAFNADIICIRIVADISIGNRIDGLELLYLCVCYMLRIWSVTDAS